MSHTQIDNHTDDDPYAALSQHLRLIDEIKWLREALAAMLIPFEGDECRRDHHGYCQTHFLEEDCCVAKARAALAEGGPDDR